MYLRMAYVPIWYPNIDNPHISYSMRKESVHLINKGNIDEGENMNIFFLQDVQSMRQD